MKHYRQVLEVEYIEDDHPLNPANRKAHQVIVFRLLERGLIVVSEQGKVLHLEAERYWLVDPLDGTKEFLVGYGEFTLKIALIDHGHPVLGVVFAPALYHFYFGCVGRMGAWSMRKGKTTALSVGTRSVSPRMAVSRFHHHPVVKIFVEQSKVEEQEKIGSVLKYGLLAEGKVDVFTRFIGSSEWDKAAGQAVLEATGGQVLDWHTGKTLQYVKPLRRNPKQLSLRFTYRREEFKLKDYESEL